MVFADMYCMYYVYIHGVCVVCNVLMSNTVAYMPPLAYKLSYIFSRSSCTAGAHNEKERLT